MLTKKLNQTARDNHGNTYVCLFAQGEGWIWEYLARQLIRKEMEISRIKMTRMSGEAGGSESGQCEGE